MDNCWSVTQSGGNEISKIGVDWFLAVLETPKKKVGGLANKWEGLCPPAPLEAYIYLKNFRHHRNYQKINKIDSGGLAVVHFVISSNASMYERLDWRKDAKSCTSEFCLTRSKICISQVR
jgi:hypothetical protein